MFMVVHVQTRSRRVLFALSKHYPSRPVFNSDPLAFHILQRRELRVWPGPAYLATPGA
jgi:hypothetical protein